MADKKISALTASTTPLAGTEVLPIVQGGATVKVAVSNLTAGRPISTTELTVSTGNVIIGTAGKGIDFSADPSAAGMTSELLDDYEEGTFTPVIVGATDAGAGTYTTQRGSYTKVGRLVTYSIGLGWTAHTGTGNMRIAGLPFTIVEGAVVAILPVGITVTGQVYGSLISAETYMNIVAIDDGTLSFLTMDTAGSFFLTGFYYV
jgi:hypothetical protein